MYDVDVGEFCFYIGVCSGCNCADVCPYYDDHEDKKHNDDEECKINGKRN